jgi:hypothetical protein
MLAAPRRAALPPASAIRAAAPPPVVPMRPVLVPPVVAAPIVTPIVAHVVAAPIVTPIVAHVFVAAVLATQPVATPTVGLVASHVLGERRRRPGSRRAEVGGLGVPTKRFLLFLSSPRCQSPRAHAPAQPGNYYHQHHAHIHIRFAKHLRRNPLAATRQRQRAARGTSPSAQSARGKATYACVWWQRTFGASRRALRKLRGGQHAARCSCAVASQRGAAPSLSARGYSCHRRRPAGS